MAPIFIITAAATVTYFSNRKSVESQNNLATKAREEEQENTISEFRHQWLQEVRSTGSELVQIIHDCQYYTKSNNLTLEDIKKNTEDTSSSSLLMQKENLEKSFDIIIKKRSEFYKYEAKLKLLFKVDETETKKLFEALESIKSTIGNKESKLLDDEKINLIIKELQIVLKTEWEATKDRTWIKNT